MSAVVDIEDGVALYTRL